MKINRRRKITATTSENPATNEHSYSIGGLSDGTCEYYLASDTSDGYVQTAVNTFEMSQYGTLAEDMFSNIVQKQEWSPDEERRGEIITFSLGKGVNPADVGELRVYYRLTDASYTAANSKLLEDKNDGSYIVLLTGLEAEKGYKYLIVLTKTSGELYRSAEHGFKALHDTDGDGMCDGEEDYGWYVTVTREGEAEKTYHVASYYISANTDVIDGLTDKEEKAAGTDPFLSDTDKDGLKDGWYDSDQDETYDMGETKGEIGDTSSGEGGYGTNVCVWDTDGDMLSDGKEVSTYKTNPGDDDTDNDGVIDSEDMNPLINVKVTVKIRNIMAIDDIDGPDGGEADFYVRVNIDGQWFPENTAPDAEEDPVNADAAQTEENGYYWTNADGSVWVNDDHKTPDEIGNRFTFTEDVPDNADTAYIQIELFDDNSAQAPNYNKDSWCDISPESTAQGSGYMPPSSYYPDGRSLVLQYNLKTGQWTGDDFIGDSNGYGHASGEEDGSTGTNEDDCEIWFDIVQTDNDRDGLVYYDEISNYETNPVCSDTDGDGWMDGRDFDPLDPDVIGKLTINTFSYNKDYAQADNDGLLIFDYLSDYYSNVNVTSKKVELFTYSYGQTLEIANVSVLLGGSCWAYAMLGSNFSLPLSGMVKLKINMQLNGEILASAGITHFKAYADIYQDGNLFKEYQFLNEQAPASWSHQTLDFEARAFELFENSYFLRIKFESNATAMGDGAYAAVDFGDVKGEGYFISISSVEIELLKPI